MSNSGGSLVESLAPKSSSSARESGPGVAGALGPSAQLHVSGVFIVILEVALVLENLLPILVVLVWLPGSARGVGDRLVAAFSVTCILSALVPTPLGLASYFSGSWYGGVPTCTTYQVTSTWCNLLSLALLTYICVNCHCAVWRLSHQPRTKPTGGLDPAPPSQETLPNRSGATHDDPSSLSVSPYRRTPAALADLSSLPVAVANSPTLVFKPEPVIAKHYKEATAHVFSDGTDTTPNHQLTSCTGATPNTNQHYGKKRYSRLQEKNPSENRPLHPKCAVDRFSPAVKHIDFDIKCVAKEISSKKLQARRNCLENNKFSNGAESLPTNYSLLAVDSNSQIGTTTNSFKQNKDFSVLLKTTNATNSKLLTQYDSQIQTSTEKFENSVCRGSCVSKTTESSGSRGAFLSGATGSSNWTSGTNQSRDHVSLWLFLLFACTLSISTLPVVGLGPAHPSHSEKSCGSWLVPSPNPVKERIFYLVFLVFVYLCLVIGSGAGISVCWQVSHRMKQERKRKSRLYHQEENVPDLAELCLLDSMKKQYSLTCVVMAGTLTWLPVAVMLTLQKSGLPISEASLMYSSIATSLPGLLNPLLYSLALVKYRTGYRVILDKCCCRNRSGIRGRQVRGDHWPAATDTIIHTTPNGHTCVHGRHNPACQPLGGYDDAEFEDDDEDSEEEVYADEDQLAQVEIQHKPAPKISEKTPLQAVLVSKPASGSCRTVLAARATTAPWQGPSQAFLPSCSDSEHLLNSSSEFADEETGL